MGLLSQILNKFRPEPRVPGKLYPEYNWKVSVVNNQLQSSDWNGNEQKIDLTSICRFYVRTTDGGPNSCDVWWGIQTETEQIEIPQGCNGEEGLLEYAHSLPGFEIKGMNSMENEIHECWLKEKN